MCTQHPRLGREVRLLPGQCRLPVRTEDCGEGQVRRPLYRYVLHTDKHTHGWVHYLFKTQAVYCEKSYSSKMLFLIFSHIVKIVLFYNFKVHLEECKFNEALPVLQYSVGSPYIPSIESQLTDSGSLDPY